MYVLCKTLILAQSYAIGRFILSSVVTIVSKQLFFLIKIYIYCRSHLTISDIVAEALDFTTNISLADSPLKV